MGNLAKAYSASIGRKSENEEVSGETAIKQQMDDELSIQTRMDWLQNPATAEMFRDMKEYEQEMINQAILESVKNTTQINTQLVVQLLVRVDTLRKLKDTYARTK